jgi:hypothetical protein
MISPIDPATVTHVLLGDRWHEVTPGTFTIDQFGFERGNGRAGPDHDGFRFHSPVQGWHAGPMIAVLAVRFEAPAP